MGVQLRQVQYEKLHHARSRQTFLHKPCLGVAASSIVRPCSLRDTESVAVSAQHR